MESCQAGHLQATDPGKLQTFLQAAALWLMRSNAK